MSRFRLKHRSRVIIPCATEHQLGVLMFGLIGLYICSGKSKGLTNHEEIIVNFRKRWPA